MKNKSFILSPDVKFKITSDVIVIKKGIWNTITIEIEKKLLKNDSDWKSFVEIWNQFSNFQEISTDNPKILNLLNDLESYFIVKSKASSYPLDYVVTDLNNKCLTTFNCPIISIDQLLEKIKRPHVKINRIFIIPNLFSAEKFLEINRLLLKHHIKCFYCLLDGNYLHLLNIDNHDLGCFECVLKRFISRHQEWNNNSKVFYSNEHLLNDELSFVISLVKLILNTSQKYDHIIINNRIFSIFLPTFEIHLDRVLKVPFCDTCGFISKNQSEELNINLKNAVNELLKHD